MIELLLNENPLEFDNVAGGTLFYNGSTTYAIHLVDWIDAPQFKIGSSPGLDDVKHTRVDREVQLTVDAGTPPVLYFSHATLTLSIQVSSDIHFVRDDAMVYLEETLPPQVDSTASVYTFTVRVGGSNPTWRNSTHSLISWTPHASVVSRLPASLSQTNWLALPGHTWTDGEVITPRFPLAAETLENQLFTSRTAESDVVPGGVSHTAALSNTITMEIDLGDMKSVDLVDAPEENSVLTYRSGKWVSHPSDPGVGVVGAEMDRQTGQLSIVSSPSPDSPWIPSFTYDGMRFEAAAEKYRIDGIEVLTYYWYVLEFGSSPAASSGETEYRVWKNVSENTLDSHGNDVKTIIFMDLDGTVGWIGYPLTNEEILEMVEVDTGIPRGGQTLEIYAYTPGSMFPPSGEVNVITSQPAIFLDQDDGGYSTQTRATVAIDVDSLRDVRIRNLKEKQTLVWEGGEFKNKTPEHATNLEMHRGLLTLTRNAAFRPYMLKMLVSNYPRYFKKSVVPVFARAYGPGEPNVMSPSVISFGKTSRGDEYHAWIECTEEGEYKVGKENEYPFIIIYVETDDVWCPCYPSLANRDFVYRTANHAISYFEDAGYWRRYNRYGSDSRYEDWEGLISMFLQSYKTLMEGTSDISSETHPYYRYVDGDYKNFGLLQDVGFHWSNDGSGFPGIARNMETGVDYTPQEVYEEIPEVYENLFDQVDDAVSINPVSAKIEMTNLYDVNIDVYKFRGVNYIQENHIFRLDWAGRPGAPMKTDIDWNSVGMHRPLWDPQTGKSWIVKDTRPLSWVLIQGRSLELDNTVSVNSLIEDTVELTEEEYPLDVPPGATTGITNGDILKWDQYHDRFLPASITTTTDTIEDFDILSPTQGDILQYDGAQWTNISPVLNTLGDVDYTATPADSGAVLQFDGTLFRLSEGPLPLFDVRGTPPEGGQVLVYSEEGDKWVPHTLTTSDHAVESVEFVDGFLNAVISDRNAPGGLAVDLGTQAIPLQVNWDEGTLLFGGSFQSTKQPTVTIYRTGTYSFAGALGRLKVSRDVLGQDEYTEGITETPDEGFVLTATSTTPNNLYCFDRLSPTPSYLAEIIVRDIDYLVFTDTGSTGYLQEENMDEHTHDYKFTLKSGSPVINGSDKSYPIYANPDNTLHVVFWDINTGLSLPSDSSPNGKMWKIIDSLPAADTPFYLPYVDLISFIEQGWSSWDSSTLYPVTTGGNPSFITTTWVDTSRVTLQTEIPLSKLSDVQIDQEPGDGQILRYDRFSSRWVPTDPTTIMSPLSASPTDLSLRDVEIDSEGLLSFRVQSTEVLTFKI